METILRSSNLQARKKPKRAVKWILPEQNFSYNDFEYHLRLRDLDLLPIKYRFILSDLLLFHSIFYTRCNINLPEYYIKYSDEEQIDSENALNHLIILVIVCKP